jgi:hypothetical protein
MTYLSRYRCRYLLYSIRVFKFNFQIVPTTIVSDNTIARKSFILNAQNDVLPLRCRLVNVNIFVNKGNHL